ncbi:hypothetical protein D9M68_893540 [compost metagenome]
MGVIVRLAITTTAVGDIHIEQVQLVVTRHTLAALIDQQRAGMRLGLGLAVRRQRDGAGNYP